jgi:hypothetical protein
MPARKPIEMRSLDLNITAKLADRVMSAAADEGMTLDGFLERAVLVAVKESEKAAGLRHSNRDPKKYPHKCDYCEDRFKLPMHRQRHVTWTHPEMVDKDETVVTGPTAEDVIHGVVEAIKEVATAETADPRFKLAPGMEDMLDEFDQRYYADVPRLD